MSAPARLVTVAHGTRTPAGNRVAAEVTGLVADRLGVEAVTAYVELSDPLLTDVLASSSTPTAVLPMLLSTGFHVRQDLPAAVAGAGGPAVLGRSLGPHALLAQAQAELLDEAGARSGTPVVLLAAGSSDELATRDLDRAAELLARTWGAPVRVATLSGRGRRPEEVVRPGDAVSTYLLAGGFFARRAAEQARAAGACVVAPVLGPHPRVVDLVARRATTLLGLLAGTTGAAPGTRTPSP